MAVGEASRAAERVARESFGRLVAFLAARTRDVAAAEDALAEAFAAALRQWPEQGVPDNPAAWLLAVARRRDADAVRRRAVEQGGADRLALIAAELEEAAAMPEAIPDRRLALMFACAHPAIERGMAAPLILQTVLGFTAQEIAAAFLVPPATMGQRLVRGKNRLRDTGIAFRVPDAEELPERLDAVLKAIYAAYARGWDQFDDAPRLAEEAIWLGRLVVDLLPGEPEARGMLALMLYTEARRDARRDGDGAFVPLDEQDVARWDQDLLAAAERLLREASASGASGRYQIEAAIQSAHVARRLGGAAAWPAILALYDHLLVQTGSPVVALNRAVALAEVEGPERALAVLDRLADDSRMASYQPYWAARGALLARADRASEAHDALTRALGLADDPAIRAHLRARIARLSD